MTKVLVFQHYLDKGFQNKNELSKYSDIKNQIITKQNSLILSKCLNSVQEWANILNYDYMLNKEKPFLKPIIECGDYIYSMYKYKVLLDIAQKSDYEYFIYLDNDMYVLKNKKFPICDLGLTTTFFPPENIWIQYYLGPLARFWCSSIFCMSKQTLIHFCEWIIKRIEGDIIEPIFLNTDNNDERISNSHEFLLSLYCEKEKHPMHLPIEWHCCPRRYVNWEQNPTILHIDSYDKGNHLLTYVPATIRKKIFNNE